MRRCDPSAPRHRNCSVFLARSALAPSPLERPRAAAQLSRRVVVPMLQRPARPRSYSQRAGSPLGRPANYPVRKTHPIQTRATQAHIPQSGSQRCRRCSDTETERQAGRHAGTQARRHAGMHAGRQPGGQAGRLAGWLAGWLAGRQAGWLAGRQADRRADRQTETDAVREVAVGVVRWAVRHSERQRQGQTDRQADPPEQ